MCRCPSTRCQHIYSHSAGDGVGHNFVEVSFANDGLFWIFFSDNTIFKMANDMWLNTTASWEVNPFGPSDAMWWHSSGSMMAHATACCLMAPSHYLNQCWLIISRVQWHSNEDNFIRNTSAINLKLTWKWLNYIFIQIFQGPMSLIMTFTSAITPTERSQQRFVMVVCTRGHHIDSLSDKSV